MATNPADAAVETPADEAAVAAEQGQGAPQESETVQTESAPAEESGVTFEDGESYSFNLAETEEDSGFAPIPKGTYLCTISQCQFQISKSSGSPMWNLTLDIAEGEFAEKNRKLFAFVSLKPEQRGRVKQFINRVAPELSNQTNFDPKKVAEEGLLIGRQLKARVDIENSEEYGNRNRVRDFLAAGASGGGSTGGTFQM